MRSRTLARALLGCSLIAMGLAPAPAAADQIVALPVAFEVRNTNASELPCASDGADYTVRGRLVGPRSALKSGNPRAVTVYLHGFNVGAFMWHPPGFPQLDHARTLAALGHVGLVIDQLGYDTSGHPHGMQACFGSWADVTHQVISQLRRGGYAVSGARPATFSKVVLAGHDAGAAAADIEAYSWEDVDGLVHLNWADQGFTQDTYAGHAPVAATCARGGDQAEQGPPSRDDPAGGPYGYVQFLDDAKIRSVQTNTEPRVVDRLSRLWNRNPCGVQLGSPQVTRTNPGKLPEIKVPVLYGYGEHEFLWTPEGLAEQAKHFSGSKDVTSVVFPDSGHFPQFSRAATAFHDAIAEWLRSRRFLSAGALTADGCPAANNTTKGTTRGNRVRGTTGADNLVGRGGRDWFFGARGDDCLKGGNGRDVVRGGEGKDLVAGDSGADIVGGGPGGDTISGGAGRDRIDAADGERDRVRCGKGRDRVRADRVDLLRGCESIRRVPRRARGDGRKR